VETGGVLVGGTGAGVFVGGAGGGVFVGSRVGTSVGSGVSVVSGGSAVAVWVSVGVIVGVRVRVAVLVTVGVPVAVLDEPLSNAPAEQSAPKIINKISSPPPNTATKGPLPPPQSAKRSNMPGVVEYDVIGRAVYGDALAGAAASGVTTGAGAGTLPGSSGPAGAASPPSRALSNRLSMIACQPGGAGATAMAASASAALM